MALELAARKTLALEAWSCIDERKEGVRWIGGAFAFAFGIACS